MAWIFGIEDGQSIPAISWAGSLPIGFTDKTIDIVSLDHYGTNKINYHWCRKMIQAAVIAKAGVDFSTWGSLTTEEQKIASKWIASPYSLRVPAHYTDEEDKANWGNVLKRSYTGRCKTIEAMRIRVGDDIRIGLITLEDAHDFYFTCTDFVEAFKHSAAPNLIQWITNEVGSAYEFDGFAQKTYFNATLKDNLLSIYNGEF